MTAIKFCGITREEDATLAAELGAAAVGLVLWPGSPRAVAPARARRVVDGLPPFVTPVAVLVSPTADDVRRVVESVGVRVVQVHGAVDLETLIDGGWTIVRATSLAGGPAAARAIDPRVTVLLDAHDPARHGGTGTTIDWTAAAGVARARRVILAGGLRPDNVAQAIAEVRPYGVDVASGVEVAPGVKDAARMRAFAAAVRAAETEGRTTA
ncbi:MAG: phosphoribosylanthranilate isomerase [Vicinamibacterales bacterium]|nr:phosphoribosylanthranilate isomerase [Vicinamibacterales bacterium]